MPSELTHAQHAAQLGFLQQYFEKQGWSSRLLERSADLPIHVLSVAAPRDSLGRERGITFAYVPLDEDDLDHISLLQFYSPLPITMNPVYEKDVDTLFRFVNPGLAIGHYGHKDGELFMRHVYTAPLHDMIREEMFIETVLLFFSLQDAASVAIEAVATGKKTVLQALTDLGLVTSPARSTKPESQTPLLDHVKAYFQKSGWEYEPVLDSAITAFFEGEEMSYRCYMQAREEDRQLIFYCISPLSAPEDKLDAISHFITRANYGLYLGNFELDVEDGEIRFKTSIAFGDEAISDQLIAPIIFPNVVAMDGYFPAIRAIIEDGIPPDEAIDVIEDELLNDDF